ncbi:hypothetical protein [Actinomycetospora atypica]|uniref:Uncharacterized protein n=1 Tax=Actinomycetospora atypica TaxID=1290095 RepID=A0ABV9YLA7_9PSEU
MGRHTAPELDAPTVEMTRANPREVDLGAWWAERTPNTRAWLAIGAIAGSALGLVSVVEANSGPSASEIAVQASIGARQAGADYARDLRDRGYYSITVMSRCSINDDGYGGSHWQDYLDGCNAVGLTMMRNGQ